MSDQGDFQKFLNGELRTDGWVSEWRREQEERRKNQVYRAAPVAPKKCRVRAIPKPQYNKEYMRQRRAQALKKGMCTDCYHTKARKGRTNCQLCQDKRNARESKRNQAKKVA